MRKRKNLSKTPRATTHNRRVPFSLAMRKKISENWVALRKEIKKKKTIRLPRLAGGKQAHNKAKKK